jgi:hypothetical protein
LCADDVDGQYRGDQGARSKQFSEKISFHNFIFFSIFSLLKDSNASIARSMGSLALSQRFRGNAGSQRDE